MDKVSRNRGRQLTLVRQIRVLSKTELSKKVSGLKSSDLTQFENGFKYIPEEKQKEIMKVLDWPFEFLDKRHSVEFLI
ncbi:helix-turn-helix domain-containing protein [Chryseobacterium sediminis]|uniref:Helix-turn-helix transcriptional regulator n=1 Tax=Chryseobacterium sediminis TaxID=1679494 RepID=A0A5B2U909_9FLAO|nr:hypothetical protein [Chryseobacterium sediminis]KAA2223029.1 hypothetical protein FW780_02155 [Chryseobacterium sediminis]